MGHLRRSKAMRLSKAITGRRPIIITIRQTRRQHMAMPTLMRHAPLTIITTHPGVIRRIICNYQVWYDPIYVGGIWYDGPIYWRNFGGERSFWLNGGWHRDEWRGARPGPYRLGPWRQHALERLRPSTPALASVAVMAAAEPFAAATLPAGVGISAAAAILPAGQAVEHRNSEGGGGFRGGNFGGGSAPQQHFAQGPAAGGGQRFGGGQNFGGGQRFGSAEARLSAAVALASVAEATLVAEARPLPAVVTPAVAAAAATTAVVAAAATTAVVAATRVAAAATHITVKRSARGSAGNYLVNSPYFPTLSLRAADAAS